jgi:hypothetical protein
MVEYACNPRTQENHEFEAGSGCTVRPCLKNKLKIIISELFGLQIRYKMWQVLKLILGLGLNDIVHESSHRYHHLMVINGVSSHTVLPA